jgi:hypothetical protein
MKHWIQQNIIWRGTIRRIKHSGCGGCIDHPAPSDVALILLEKIFFPQGCYVTIIPPPFFLMIGITDCIALTALEMASNVR